ncbi:hypothetical protein HETIRDRAFT_330024 [Heterobasidion irregulare TC 32-1]|uniref:Uncharacterized protein n=1 Tax=Heterobasidion irregulare (strain TC 32-1) TaxID=747525 RepID=W4JQ99_HETIT|nr:uncharacterized protein HETIRDRAFT_330024 [Heterobasidion irregulare TC 32-1]ETW75737.1 hypothetical protein HETIRDRAFT_330024 [Heterobasidion irregulare TC 32-1]
MTMPHLEWTTPAEKSWLETRVRAEYTYQTDATRYNWSRGIARDFMDEFPREKRELKGRLESDEELEERWRKVETRVRTWIRNHHNRVLHGPTSPSILSPSRRTRTRTRAKSPRDFILKGDQLTVHKHSELNKLHREGKITKAQKMAQFGRFVSGRLALPEVKALCKAMADEFNQSRHQITASVESTDSLHIAQPPAPHPEAVAGPSFTHHFESLTVDRTVASESFNYSHEFLMLLNDDHIHYAEDLFPVEEQAQAADNVVLDHTYTYTFPTDMLPTLLNTSPTIPQPNSPSALLDDSHPNAENSLGW